MTTAPAVIFTVSAGALVLAQGIGDELAAIKEITAFAALLVIMLWAIRRMADKLGEIAPKLASLQSAFEKGAIEHREALDRNTDSHDRSDATLQKLVEQIHLSQQAMLANISTLADRNLERTSSWTRGVETALADLRLQLVEIKSRLGMNGGHGEGKPTGR